MSDHDDTDMTNDEFETAFAESVPCDVYVPGNRGGSSTVLTVDWRTLSSESER